MRLRDSTRKIITQLEEKSGYPVQVLEEADLPTFATIRIARAGVPAHVLSIKSPPPKLTIQLPGSAPWLCDCSSARRGSAASLPVRRKAPGS